MPREWKPHMPRVGDYLQWKSDSHAIYTDFPDGDVVLPTDHYVDFTEYLEVTKSQRAMCWRYHNGRQKYVICHYVGVQFRHYGDLFWTTFSRDQEQWLWTHGEMEYHENNNE